MSPVAVIWTTILMGLLVLVGGAWAALYCLAQVRAQRGLMHIARACYAVALALALAIAAFTPLDMRWKLLIVVSALAYAVIPPITLRHLRGLHEEPETHP